MTQTLTRAITARTLLEHANRIDPEPQSIAEVHLSYQALWGQLIVVLARHWFRYHRELPLTAGDFINTAVPLLHLGLLSNLPRFERDLDRVNVAALSNPMWSRELYLDHSSTRSAAHRIIEDLEDGFSMPLEELLSQFGPLCAYFGGTLETLVEVYLAAPSAEAIFAATVLPRPQVG